LGTIELLFVKPPLFLNLRPLNYVAVFSFVAAMHRAQQQRIKWPRLPGILILRICWVGVGGGIERKWSVRAQACAVRRRWTHENEETALLAAALAESQTGRVAHPAGKWLS